MKTLREMCSSFKCWLWKRAFMKPIIFLRHVVMYARGRLILKKLLAEKKDDEIYLLTPWGIGDILYTLSSLEELLRYYSDKRIVVFGDIKHEKIFRSYTENPRLSFRLKPFQSKICKYICYFNLPELSASHNIFMTMTGEYDSLKSVKVATIHKIRKYIFKLPEDGTITHHGLQKETVTAIPEFEKIKHKTVIINPYSNSGHTTRALYERLAIELERMGYEVYANITPSQKRLQNCRTLDCSISELYSITCEIPLIVSVRSGILDLTVTSGVNMFVIYEFLKDKPIDFELSNLTEWECDGKIMNVAFRIGSSPDYIVQKLHDFIDELKKENRIS